MGGIHEYNKTGRMKRPSYKDTVAWIVESWAAVNENCVRNGFIKARGDDAVPVTVIMYMTIHFQKWKLKKYQKRS
jgi:hypothetical protein